MALSARNCRGAATRFFKFIYKQALRRTCAIINNYLHAFNKKEAPSSDKITSDDGALILSKGENPAFFLCRNALSSYCPYTEKPPQAASSPILNPNSCVF